VAGWDIPLRSVIDMRGTSIPLDVDLTSSIADGSGALPSELTLTWANISLLKSRSIAIKKDRFFTVLFFGLVIPRKFLFFEE